MTTSWSYFVRGEIGPALRANLGGALLAVLSVLVLPITTWKLLTGSTLSNRQAWVAVVGLFLTIVASMVDWMLKLTE
jgi:ABC-type multidrug transport system permease subunit